MTRPLSNDLRKRLVAAPAVSKGESCRAVVIAVWGFRFRLR